MPLTADATSDEALYRRFVGGDYRAFEQLYARYRLPLYRFLLRAGGEPADAEDLYQDVWMRILHRREAFRAGSFQAFVYRVARNLQIDGFRRRQLRPVVDSNTNDATPDPAPQPDQRTHDTDCGERLLQEVAVLPMDQRDAFLLKEQAGLSLAQIAELTSQGRETIKSRLRYALARLRKALEDCL